MERHSGFAGACCLLGALWAAGAWAQPPAQKSRSGGSESAPATQPANPGTGGRTDSNPERTTTTPGPGNNASQPAPAANQPAPQAGPGNPDARDGAVKGQGNVRGSSADTAPGGKQPGGTAGSGGHKQNRRGH